MNEVVAGAGLFAFISSFLPWYGSTVTVLGLRSTSSLDAWDSGFAAWFAVLLLAGAGVLALLGLVDGRQRRSIPRWLAMLGLSILAFGLILGRWATFRDQAVLQGTSQHFDISVGGAFSASGGVQSGLYLCLLAAIVAVVGSIRMPRP
ncbi:hypothetical protein [Pseudonocardia spinosispora]|uniref:hypothetical protein n=1 Tax=Pseudonocardia spinosispora TaxID=103441 RepID=UPI0003FB5769|nr:hypothetical protein [Pseudonocardia spinosispora]